MATNLKERLKMLDKLKALGIDPSLGELVFHLDKISGLLKEIKNDSVANDVTDLSKKLDNLNQLIKTFLQKPNPAENLPEILESSMGGLKDALLELKPKDIDFSSINKGLTLLLNKDNNKGILIKINDSFLDLKKALEENKPLPIDTGYKQVVGGISSLEKKLLEEFAKMLKALSVINLSGGGKGSYVVTTLKSSTLANPPSEVTVGTGSIQLLALNNSRKRLMVQNVGTTKVYLLLGTGTASTSLYSVALASGTASNDGTGGSYIDELWQGPVQIVGSAGGGSVALTEII